MLDYLSTPRTFSNTEPRHSWNDRILHYCRHGNQVLQQSIVYCVSWKKLTYAAYIARFYWLPIIHYKSIGAVVKYGIFSVLMTAWFQGEGGKQEYLYLPNLPLSAIFSKVSISPGAKPLSWAFFSTVSKCFCRTSFLRGVRSFAEKPKTYRGYVIH